MTHLGLMFRFLVLLAAALVAAPLLAKDKSAPEAVLTVANRDIVALRATVQGTTPEIRVKRIGERIRELDENALTAPVTHSHMTIENVKAIYFTIGDRPIFVLYSEDLDEGDKLSDDRVAEKITKRLEAALAGGMTRSCSRGS